MTKDDIIKLAREAGWSGLYTTYNAPTGKADWKMVNETMEQIERFAALVAAAEREACAALAEKTICDNPVPNKPIPFNPNDHEDAPW